MVSARRIRAYFWLFGVAGAWIMLATLGQVYPSAASLNERFAVIAAPTLLVGHLAQILVCFGYIFVGWRLPTLLKEESTLPQRLVKLSMAIAAMVACVRMALMLSPEMVIMLLSFLLNAAFNLPLLQMVQQAAKTSEADRAKPAL